MVTPVIHRIIEGHAAACGNVAAILHGAKAVTYRDLNVRANTAARRLQAAGFHRGGRAVVQMPRGADLAVLLLAVLKAGGAYTWVDAADGAPCAVSIMPAPGRRGWAVTLQSHELLGAPPHACPNLPILTRDSEIACVLRDGSGADAILIPHATIVSLRAGAMSAAARWEGEPGALDLWHVLLSAGTLTLEGEPAQVAAA